MQNSIHTARWVNQLAGQGWDIHLFGVREFDPHPQLRNITYYDLEPVRGRKLDPSVRLRLAWPWYRGAGRVRGLAYRFAPWVADRAHWLAHVIRRLKPDLVHSLEFQQGAYLAL